MKLQLLYYFFSLIPGEVSLIQFETDFRSNISSSKVPDEDNGRLNGKLILPFRVHRKTTKPVSYFRFVPSNSLRFDKIFMIRIRILTQFRTINHPGFEQQFHPYPGVGLKDAAFIKRRGML